MSIFIKKTDIAKATIRIGFLSPLAYNYFFPGKIKQAGGHTRIYHLAKKLASIPGFEVTCITGDFGQPDIIAKDGVKLVKSQISNPFALFSVLKTLKSLNLDIYVDVYASPRLFLLYILKIFFGLRYAFLTGSDVDVDGSYRYIDNGFYYTAYIKALRNADAIICQTPLHVKLLRKNFNLSSDLVISPYLDIKRSKQSVQKDSMIWIGRAASYKNPMLFIDIVKSFPNLNFVMICNHSDYDDGFMDYMAQNQCDYPNLEFLEYADNEEVHVRLEKAKLLVNTSDFEGFPNTFIEAAMHRTPVLSLKSNPNNMLSSHGAGIWCNGDVAKLFEFFVFLEAGKIDVDTLGECAYSYALKYHQLDAAAKKVGVILKKIKACGSS